MKEIAVQSKLTSWGLAGAQGQELAKAAAGKIPHRLNAAGGPKNIRICGACRIGCMIPDARCSYCNYCGFSTCG